MFIKICYSSKSIAMLVSLAIGIQLTGCTTLKPFDVKELSRRERVAAGFTSLEDTWGLALSGGGSRSASFNVGVLKALFEYRYPGEDRNRDNLIKKFDYLSSVSGGSWASYWFYMHELYKDNPIKKHIVSECPSSSVEYKTKDIFAIKEELPIGEPVNSFRFQHHLENNSEFINITKSKLARYIENGFTGLMHGVEALTFHKIFDGVFDAYPDTSLLKPTYRMGLERTYGLVPCDLSDPEKFTFLNQKSAALIVNDQAGQARKVSFHQLAKLIKKRSIHAEKEGTNDELFRLPIPIINTAMGYDGKIPKKFEQSVFWVTPFTFGSAGKNNYESPYSALKFSHLVAASGAAMDGQARGYKDIEDFGMWLFNLNLGYKVPNPRSRQHEKINSGLAPFPIYALVNKLWLAERRPFVRLSDGGHADNLGVYALVQRQVKNIVVIDAEHDPEMSYQGLKSLTSHLKNELGYQLVPKTEVGGAAFEPGRVDSKKAVMVADLVPEDKSGRKRLTLYYIKLTFDESRTGYPGGEKKNFTACAVNPHDAIGKAFYPCSVVDFYKNDFKKPRSNRFPQNATTDVYYDSLQFKAYRDLGYVLITEQLLLRPEFAQ